MRKAIATLAIPVLLALGGGYCNNLANRGPVAQADSTAEVDEPVDPITSAMRMLTESYGSQCRRLPHDIQKLHQGYDSLLFHLDGIGVETSSITHLKEMASTEMEISKRLAHNCKDNNDYFQAHRSAQVGIGYITAAYGVAVDHVELVRFPVDF